MITTFVCFLAKTLYVAYTYFLLDPRTADNELPSSALIHLEDLSKHLLKSEQAHNCAFEGKKCKPNKVSDSQP
jgi:hypothetical protein